MPFRLRGAMAGGGAAQGGSPAGRRASRSPWWGCARRAAGARLLCAGGVALGLRCSSLGLAGSGVAAPRSCAAGLAGRRCGGALPARALQGSTLSPPPLVAPELEEVVDGIMERLRSSEAAQIDGVPAELHEVSAMFEPSDWDELGRLTQQCEEAAALDGSKWATLRLEGIDFGAVVENLRADGIIGPGYSAEIGELMGVSCRAIMDEFRADFAYVHSDEVIAFLAPRRTRRDGRHLDFPFNGRMQKWVSIAASLVSGVFNRKLWRLVAERGGQLDPRYTAHFSCRVGVLESEAAALGMLLWRAYDCNVDAAQSACRYHGAPAAGYPEQIKWLHDAGKLPMDNHQAYGSLYVRSMAQFDAFDQATNESVVVARRVNVLTNDGVADTPRNLLNALRAGRPIVASSPDDPRLAIRSGCFWRYAGSTGGGEGRRSDGQSKKRRRSRRGGRRR